MQTERWQEIERIFQSALALKGVERTAYLDEPCRGDEALRQEVESLLAELGTPNFQLAISMIERRNADLRVKT